MSSRKEMVYFQKRHTVLYDDGVPDEASRFLDPGSTEEKDANCGTEQCFRSDESNVQSCLSGIGVRHLQAVLLFFCLCVNYMMRVNLSIGIVLMTDKNTTFHVKVFDWTVAEQSTIQSAFFVGYLLMNLVAAVLVTRINIKYLLLYSAAVSSAITIATPVLVTAGGYYIFLIIRCILGIMQGAMMASVWGVKSKWIPPSERSRCGALVLGGIHVGNLISFSVSGWIGSNYGGWPSIFYFTGISGAIWVIVWAFIGAESPGTCTFVSAEERKFIEKELAETPTLPKNIPIPWFEMLKSKACWAILIASLGQAWGYWTLVTEIPSYFNAVLHFSPTINGLVTALPYACMWIICLLASFVSEKLQARGIISATFNRKMNNSIGHYGAAICLVVLASTTHREVAISMYIFGVTFLGFAYIGHNITHFDIVPNFAGFLMGITNGLANVTSLSGPLFAGQIIHDPSNVAEWRIVFLVSAAIFALGNTLFIILGTSQVQPFNKIPEGYEVKADVEKVAHVDKSSQGKTLR